MGWFAETPAARHASTAASVTKSFDVVYVCIVSVNSLCDTPEDGSGCGFATAVDWAPSIHMCAHTHKWQHSAYHGLIAETGRVQATSLWVSDGWQEADKCMNRVSARAGRAFGSAVSTKRPCLARRGWDACEFATHLKRTWFAAVHCCDAYVAYRASISPCDLNKAAVKKPTQGPNGGVEAAAGSCGASARQAQFCGISMRTSVRVLSECLQNPWPAHHQGWLTSTVGHGIDAARACQIT